VLLALFTRAQSWRGDVRARAREDRGASAVEYGLLVALIAAVIVAIVSVLGKKVSNAFNSVNVNLP
jgi:pilus assembly protein Flp/PilA